MAGQEDSPPEAPLNGQHALVKTAQDTAPTVPTLYKPSHGIGALLTGGMPGNRGGGRKPNTLRAALQERAEAPETLASVNAILSNPEHPQFSQVLKISLAWGIGVPTKQEDDQAEEVPYVILDL